MHDEHARIIVLTTFDGDEDIYRAIQAGAKGYLLKDVPREALMDSIRRVNAGETCVPVHLAAKLAERVSGETLSSREIDVLKLMAQGKSNKEIGSALFISEGTVKSHVKAIFAKMNVISRTEAVASATRRGLDPTVGGAPLSNPSECQPQRIRPSQPIKDLRSLRVLSACYLGSDSIAFPLIYPSRHC